MTAVKTHRNGKKQLKATGNTGGNTGGRFQKGTDVRRGVGLKGRAGRKPDEFKAMCEAACDDVVLPKVLAYLKEQKAKPDDPWWWKCADYVTGYGKGKPAQSVTIKPDEDAPPFRFTLNLGAAAIHEGDDE
jgi:hypothetical protein